MPTKTVEAIILSRKDFGEADRLITAFSKKEGKIKILAKGSRKLKSKMASHIEPFSVGEYFLAEGKSFYILAGAQSISQNQTNIENLELYKKASYICEILDMTIMENQGNEQLFQISKTILGELPKLTEQKAELMITFFDFAVLEANGYLPDYRTCRQCHKVLPEQTQYLGGFEGFYCNVCKGTGKKLSFNAVKILRLFATLEIDKILKVKGAEYYNEEIKEVIIPYLYDIIPRIPKSKGL